MHQFEAVIGLEVHIQLLTESKAYSSDPTEYGGMPNTHISPVTLGHPGTLPFLNKKVVEFAVKLGLACGCEITRFNQFARKNYFYADLPKGYQITQDTTPICTGGTISIKTENGDRSINLTRIHLEEDAGKSIHDQLPDESLIDLNRAGVPLLEIVSEPEIKSSEEAYQYLTEVRKLVRYLEICDGNMEEGSLRCDANISVRPIGQIELGKKVEVKNMNSIRNVQRAIEYEIKRQIAAIEKGEIINVETRSFDAVKGNTFSMRSKEMANDYRYFPEPDMTPLLISDEYLLRVKNDMPPLPQQLFKKYTGDLGLNEYDAGVLTDSKELAMYFEEMIVLCKNYKAAANWIMGPVKSYLNENALHINQFPIKASRLAELQDLVETGVVSHTVASQQLFPELALKDSDPKTIAQELNLIQESDSGALDAYVQEALNKFPDKVAEYRSGKTGLLGLFMGEVMKISKGKADPKIASELVKKALEQE